MNAIQTHDLYKCVVTPVTWVYDMFIKMTVVMVKNMYIKSVMN